MILFFYTAKNLVSSHSVFCVLSYSFTSGRLWVSVLLYQRLWKQFQQNHVLPKIFARTS